jgi:flagellar export protein FliJ
MANADNLRTLIRLHRNQADVIRREIADLEKQVSALEEVDASLAHQLEEERKLAADITGGLATFFGGFAQRVKARREAIAEEIARLEEAIALKRDELAEAFRTIKTYEIALEELLEEERMLQQSRENKQLDEVAMQQFVRSGEEG